jgi:methylated-DNA-[protein]-cysteine S-methyltransferase
MKLYDRAFLETPIGTAEIVGDKDGIVSISVRDEKPETCSEIPKSLQECVQQLKEYFKGSRTEFSLNLNPKGTAFQKKVWEELSRIPFGVTTTYLKQTLQLGNEKAIRAVASANGKNPIWIIIPCHRVIGSDGSLTGYAGGLWRKKWLLEHENPSGQTSLFT